MDKRRKVTLIGLIILAAAIVLMALPIDAVARYNHVSDLHALEHLDYRYSYFSSELCKSETPTPLITAIAACVMLLLAILDFILDKVFLGKIVLVLSVLTAVLSFVHFFSSTVLITVYAIIITALLFGFIIVNIILAMTLRGE